VLTRGASTFASERWVQRGFRPAAGMAPPGTTMRNLMGQLDGTRNPDPSVEPELLWEADGPEWMVGGTSMVVRRIAMDLEAWDRVDRAGREHALGRRVGSGAPLTGTAEHDEPDLAATDALGLPVIDTAAHIRRARTQDPRERFLRRGYSFDDPSEPPATRAGLVFVAFQRDVLHQFVPVQERLAELDLMNVWTTPVGSAVFAVPGGVEPGGVLGGALLA
jgi:dye decolorizing peroxidase